MQTQTCTVVQVIDNAENSLTCADYGPAKWFWSRMNKAQKAAFDDFQDFWYALMCRMGA